MAITHEQVIRLRDSLEDGYRTRHDALRRLRECWHGNYWKDLDRASETAIGRIFNDLTNRRSDIGPDVRLVHNVLQEICVKYMSYLSGLPQIRCYIDPPLSPRSRKQSSLKERALYGIWAEGDMAQIINDAAWYLPLMGDCYLGIWPDFERNIPRPVLRSPEYAYPLQNFQGTGADGIIFSWKVPESRVIRAFPNYKPKADRNPGGRVRRSFSRSPGPSEPVVEVVEYSDEKEWARWADGQKLNGVEHNYGFNLWENLYFIRVPDEPFNHGAVEQIVGLVQAGNVLHSLLLQEVIETVFSPIVLENPMKFGETLETGAGAVIGVNEGGRAYRLEPASGALGAHVGFKNETERMAKQGGSMPDVNFGVSPASSIVTGKAVNELQGAGTGSTVEMVQAVGIGNGLVSFNEKALYMLANTFGDEQIYLHGIRPRSATDINPQRFGLKFKGSEIVGSQRNEVVFSPHMNLHEKVVINLQLAGGGIVSKQYQADQAGIPDWQAMDEEIISERMQEAVLGAMEQSLLAEPSPGHEADVEQQAIAFLGGAVPAAGSPAALAPPPPGGAPPGAAPPGAGAGGPPIGPLGPGAPGQAISQALPLPPGSPPPALSEPTTPPAAAAAASTSGNITLDEVSAAFSQIQGLNGRVFLVGELVQRGETNGDIEVALTVSDDRQIITSALPQYAQRLTFHVVADEPDEDHLEVTAGAPAPVPA